MSSQSPTANFSTVFAEVAAMEAEATNFEDEVKVLVLRQFTIEGIETLIKHYLYPQKIRPIIEFGGYGSMVQDFLTAEANVGSNPDLIVLALSIDALDQNFGSPNWKMDLVRKELANLFDLLVSNTRATIAVHNFIKPLWPEHGLVANAEGLDLAGQVTELNKFVLETVHEHAPRFVLMDWDRYLYQLGAGTALDERNRYLWSAPFRRPFLDLWARQLSRVVCALRARAKKVLVLDCDNTLWGGVIGEDGMDGIRLDANQYPGRAFYDFQTSVLHLAQRGVLIVLCSKNNEADVLEVLDRHPWCRIKRNHLAAWRVNWSNKADNIAELAAELNLGLDSFVFVDDNPAECLLVSELMPAVTVLQVPKKLYELPPLLLRDGLFDTLTSTQEDKARASLYQQESKRKQFRSTYKTIDDYLKSMQTVAVIHPVSLGEVPRVAQLTQKTNQFNLTTRRYSEVDIRSMIADQNTAVYSLAARDRFGILGLVGVLIVRITSNVGTVDTFLMSCRALGRRLENAMIEHCLKHLSDAHKIDQWTAEYIPTAKNAQVASFWPSLGFEAVEVTDDRQIYACSTDTLIHEENTFVKIEEN